MSETIEFSVKDIPKDGISPTGNRNTGPSKYVDLFEKASCLMKGKCVSIPVNGEAAEKAKKRISQWTYTAVGQAYKGKFHFNIHRDGDKQSIIITKK